MEMTRRQKRRWLIEFALASLVPIMLLGVGIDQALRADISDRAIASARGEAEAASHLGVDRLLTSGRNLSTDLTRQEREAFDASLRAAFNEDRISRVTIWDAQNQPVYSGDEGVAASVVPSADQLRSSLEGNIVTKVGERDEGADAGVDGRVLKVYVPMRPPYEQTPVGVFEAWLPYEPIASAIASESRKLDLILIAGLLLLYATLFGIVAGASKRLRTQAADKEQQALRDALTGLANRTQFHNLVQRAILGSRRKKGTMAVMLMDLDRFKEINDTLGHSNGDLLLQRIGGRLQGVLRDNKAIARLGGDEFAILLTDASDKSAVTSVVRRVLKTLEEPIAVGGLALRVEASIGVAMFPEHGKRVDSLIRAADVAMYSAKAARSGFEFYTAEHNKTDAGRLALIGELRRAMDDNELRLYYQPKLDLQTGSVIGVEALARWQHPIRGLLAPDEFIPLAEQTNLLRPVTLHLIEEALRQLSAWQRIGLDVSVAVNLSMQNLLDLQLPADLDRLLASWRLRPNSLQLEITESMIMADPRRAMTILTRLSDMGLKLSVDDFGTGYSSLAYLKQLPVSQLKIDKSFVMTMDEDPDNATIVQSTIDLGHNLGLQVVAEGIESGSVLKQLAALGCDIGQGYFLSRPLPPDRMTVWLEAISGEGGAPIEGSESVDAESSSSQSLAV